MGKASRKKKSAIATSTTHTIVPQRYVKAKKVALSKFEGDIQEIKELVAKSSVNEELDFLIFYCAVISANLFQALPLIVNVRINQKVSKLVNQNHKLISTCFQEIRKTISSFILPEPPTEYSIRSSAITTWKNRCVTNVEELERAIKNEYFDEKTEYDEFRIRVLIVTTTILLPVMIGTMRRKSGYRELDSKMFNDVVGNDLGDGEKLLKVGMYKAVIESVRAKEKGEKDLRYKDFMWELLKNEKVIDTSDEEEEEEPGKDVAETTKKEVIEIRDEGAEGVPKKDLAGTMLQEEVIETHDEEAEEAAAAEKEEEQRKKDLVEMMLPIGGLRITIFDANDLFRDDAQER